MARPIVMPSLGMFTAEGTLTSWLKADGETVAAGDVVAEITTEKATYEIEAPESGRLHASVAVGTDLKVQGVLGYILAEGEAPPAAPAAAPPAPVARAASPAARPPAPAPAGGAAPPAGEVRATPVARRLAGQHGIDLATVTGTGPGGRIVEADVQAAVERQAAAPSAAGPQRQIAQRRPLIGIRRTIGERLRQSLQTTVPVTLIREIEADALVAGRAALAGRLGRSIPYDALFVGLFARALRAHPALNAVIEGDEILVLDEVNIGFAVAAPAGLLVPVISGADARPIGDLSAAVEDLAARARTGRLMPDEMAGGTATITNLGAFGVDAFTPIINPPQSVILGIGRLRSRPAIVDGQLVAQAVMTLSLTFDHRVADGAPAAELLGAVATLANDPAALIGLA